MLLLLVLSGGGLGHFRILGVEIFSNDQGFKIIKSCTDVASNLLAIDLRLDIRIACDGLQQKFQHAE